jgi:hypothetical protein
MLKIETHWNKVTPDPRAPFGSRVLPEYECKDVCTYPNAGGWTDRAAWRAHVAAMKGFAGFDEHGRAKIDQGRSYGIHSYQVVSVTID